MKVPPDIETLRALLELQAFPAWTKVLGYLQMEATKEMEQLVTLPLDMVPVMQGRLQFLREFLDLAASAPQALAKREARSSR